MSADTSNGRQIAESMMDRAEARYRHEHGQPHRRDRCEDCAREAVADAARPVHLREAAASLYRLAARRKATAPDAVAYARAEGLDEAATLLDHTADDLTDELSATDTEGAR